MVSDPTSENPQKKPNSINLMERVIILEAQHKSMEEFMGRVSRSLWVAESLEVVLSTIGGPLRKAIEMVIAATILYILAHIRFAP